MNYPAAHDDITGLMSYIFEELLTNDIHREKVCFEITETVAVTNLTDVAEYVENDDILEKLREIGIDYAQGFGIEKPLLLNSVAERAA